MNNSSNSFTTIKPVKSFTRSEFLKLMEYVKTKECRYRIRNYALFRVTEYLALRANEVCNLKKCYYDRQHHTMYVPRSKNGIDNNLKIIDKEVIQALNEHLDTDKIGKSSEFIFCSKYGNQLRRDYISTLFKEYLDSADFFIPEGKTFHSLRHTRGQYLADQGLDTKEVQFWLGHRYVENTYIYFQFSQQQQETMYRKLIKSEKKKKR